MIYQRLLKSKWNGISPVGFDIGTDTVKSTFLSIGYMNTEYSYVFIFSETHHHFSYTVKPNGREDKGLDCPFNLKSLR